jgi:chromosome segregation ATPase
MSSEEGKNSSLLSNIEDKDRPTFNQETLKKIDSIYDEFLKQAKHHFVLANLEDEIKFLYDSLNTIHKNETQLCFKLLNLKRDHKELSAKYDQALKLASSDQKVKQNLIEDLEKAWNQATLAKSKEKSTMETVKSLKLEISNLSKLVEQGVGLTMGQEYNLREIIKEKERTLADNKLFTEEIEELKSKINELEKVEDESNKVVEEEKFKTAQSNQELLACKLEIQRLNRNLEKSQEEIYQQKRICENKESNIMRLNHTLESIKEDNGKSNQVIKNLQSNLEKVRKECELSIFKQQKLQDEIDKLYLRNDTLQVENGQMYQQLKLKDESIDVHKSENFHMQKLRQSTERKIKQNEHEKNDLIVQRQELEFKLNILNKDFENLEKENENLKIKIETFNIERDRLNNELKKVLIESQKQNDQNKLLKQEIESLTTNFETLKKEYDTLRLSKTKHEEQKLKLNENMNNLCSKFTKANQNLKLKDLRIESYEKQLKIFQSKIADSNKMYESLRNERNQLSKHLNQLKEENSKQKTKIDSLKSQEVKLNKILNEKNQELISIKEFLIKTEQQLENSGLKLDKSELKSKELSLKVVQLESDERRLIEIINQLESREKISKLNYSKLEIERNVLGTQLIRRNDELSLLYEKIKLLEKIISRGKVSYSLMSEELHRTRLKLKTFEKKNLALKNASKKVDVLKQELNLNEKELYIEKAKRKVIENNQNTVFVNIHRWRKLKLCDPSTYDLILKVNFLEKRLIVKSQQIASLHLKFIEKDKLFIELKKFLLRRVMAEEDILIIQKYRENLQNSDIKLKVNILFSLKCLAFKKILKQSCKTIIQSGRSKLIASSKNWIQ